jgi:hypothetical protein
MMYAARHFFGTDTVTFQFTSTVAGTSPRTYHRFTAVVKDTINARLWNGYHFRTPDAQGAILGQNVARWVFRNYFRPVD